MLFAFLSLFLSLGGIGCARGFEPQVSSDSMASEGSKEEFPVDAGTPNIDPVSPVESDPIASAPITTQPPDFDLGICSRLDFSQITWPSKLPVQDRKAMALALNITGSYEGGAGWANLAGNFDGQGVSLGLNQQNLGQNTLQPLIITFLKDNPTMAQKLFSASNLSSLKKMLTTWKGSSISSVDELSQKGSGDSLEISEESLFPEVESLSKLDEGGDEVMFKPFDARSSASVAWAKSTVLLSSGSFKSDWKKSFTDLAVTAPYRSAQLEEARSLFTRAQGYFVSLGFTELRSLLVMYDFVVQNGGFNKDHLLKFRQFNQANPRATETARLLKLLEIRLVSVRAQYRNDVKARKSTIINGVGKVHGANRDLEKEYCSRLRVPAVAAPVPGPA